MAAHERDRLFGVLAVRIGLLDEAQLADALRDAGRGADRPMADRLIAAGLLDTEQCAVVEAVVRAHLARHGGEAAAFLTALDDSRTTQDASTDEGDDAPGVTRSHVDSGSVTGELAGLRLDPAADRSSAGSWRFRVLRPHARGGLGEVSVAIDERLNREVALKRLLERHADNPVSRSRFLIEAEITGGLEHPGIVPVYDLGVGADGRPYYAMRLVRGDTLRRAVERFRADAALKADAGRRSLELRRLLARFTDTCQAIDYAHSRGVVHRDIKPSNIIVGRHGETLVIDWGVAKVMGRADVASGAEERALIPRSADGSPETMPGSAMGTPSFMSPEQAAGDLGRVGVASDVYGLGATLYFILTGRAPFMGTDVAAVLRAVERGDFPPPRQLDAAIDPALASIAVKAMALRPEDRYPGARALAEDIERWMADEPVSAYRDGWAASIARWARHHRSAALSGVAALATLAVATTIAAVLIDRARAGERAARSQAMAHYEDARRQQLRAETNFDLARRAVDDYFTNVSEETLLEEPGFQPLRKKLLGAARTFYEALTRDQRGDRSVRAEWVRTGLRLATITDALGRVDEALEIYRSCVPEFEALLRGSPDDPSLLAGLGECLTRSARLQTTLTHVSEAEALIRRALEVTGSHRDDPLDRYRAEALQELSWIEQISGRHADSRRHMEEAIGLREALVDRHPEDDRLRAGLAAVYLESGRQVIGARRELTVRRLRRACEIEEAFVRKSPQSFVHRTALGRAHYHLGHLHWVAERWPECIPDLEAARVEWEWAAGANPSVVGLRYNLATVYRDLGVARTSMGALDTAIPNLLRATELCQSTLRDDPQNLDYLKRYADCCEEAGLALERAGRPDEAVSWSLRGVEASRQVVTRQPDDVWTVPGHAVSLAHLGSRLLAVGRNPEALAAYREAMDVVATPMGSAVLNHEPDFLGRHRLRLYRCLVELGKPGEADEVMAAYRAGPAVSPDFLYEMAKEEAEMRRTPGPSSASRPDPHPDHAMAWLRMAVGAGWKDPGRLIGDPALEPMRTRDDFRRLLMDVAMPDDPFAPLP